MPRKRPTKKLGVYGSLDINPEYAVSSYIESKQQEKFYIKSPIWDVSRDALELFAIQNERDNYDMEILQKEMLENAQRQKILNARRVREMYKIQRDLREQFVSVNNFIRDCQEKKVAAERKIVDEQNNHKQLEDATEKLVKDIEELESFEEILKETVRELEPYEKITQDVVANNDILKSVSDCMARCDALMLAQVEITELQQQKIKKVEKLRQRMVQTTNDASQTILGLNNELAKMERSYSLAKTKSLKLEKVIAGIKDFISGNELTKNQILDAIQQVYGMLCRRNGDDQICDRSNIEGQLDYIKNEIEILQEVVNICTEEIKPKPKLSTKTKVVKKKIEKKLPTPRKSIIGKTKEVKITKWKDSVASSDREPKDSNIKEQRLSKESHSSKRSGVNFNEEQMPRTSEHKGSIASTVKGLKDPKHPKMKIRIAEPDETAV